jgi:hypothetical protein
VVKKIGRTKRNKRVEEEKKGEENRGEGRLR